MGRPPLVPADFSWAVSIKLVSEQEQEQEQAVAPFQHGAQGVSNQFQIIQSDRKLLGQASKISYRGPGIRELLLDAADQFEK